MTFFYYPHQKQITPTIEKKPKSFYSVIWIKIYKWTYSIVFTFLNSFFHPGNSIVNRYGTNIKTFFFFQLFYLIILWRNKSIIPGVLYLFMTYIFFIALIFYIFILKEHWDKILRRNYKQSKKRPRKQYDIKQI